MKNTTRGVFLPVMLVLVFTILLPEGEGRRPVNASGFQVETADTGPDLSVTLLPPRFVLGGARGFYRETKAGSCLVRAPGPVRVEFSASPLAYSAGGGVELEVVYWVDWPENEHYSFRPGGPPLALRKDDKKGYRRFAVYGGVTIHEVSEQPAGGYGGTITVTVTPE